MSELNSIGTDRYYFGLKKYLVELKVPLNSSSDRERVKIIGNA